MDRFLHADVRAAAADVAGHRSVDVVVGRLGVLVEQRDGRHDLPRLAVPALDDVGLGPRLLYRVQTVGGQPFDRGDLFRGDAARGGDARTDGLAVDVHRTRATLRHTATELRA